MRLRTRVLNLTSALVALLLVGTALPVSARWYQVEVVVFEHTDGASRGNEQWPELAVLPDYSQAMDLITDLPAMTDEPASAAGAGANEPVAFVPLARADMRLAVIAQRLGTARGYHPLFATAWRQPSFGVAGARRVYLSDVPGSDRGSSRGTRTGILVDQTGPPDLLTPKVEGTVSLKVERLLHVTVDFLYYHDNLPVRLQETRGVKFREIHYFDHPLFGVLVQVTPYVLPEVPATAEVSADEPLDDTGEAPVNAPGTPPLPAPIPQAPPAPAPALR